MCLDLNFCIQSSVSILSLTSVHTGISNSGWLSNESFQRLSLPHLYPPTPIGKNRLPALNICSIFQFQYPHVAVSDLLTHMPAENNFIRQIDWNICLYTSFFAFSLIDVFLKLLRSPSFTLNLVSENILCISFCGSIAHFFLLQNSVSLYGCTNLFMHSSVEVILVVSSFGQLGIKLSEIFSCRILCGHKF